MLEGIIRTNANVFYCTRTKLNDLGDGKSMERRVVDARTRDHRGN